MVYLKKLTVAKLEANLRDKLSKMNFPAYEQNFNRL